MSSRLVANLYPCAQARAFALSLLPLFLLLLPPSKSDSSLWVRVRVHVHVCGGDDRGRSSAACIPSFAIPELPESRLDVDVAAAQRHLDDVASLLNTISSKDTPGNANYGAGADDTSSGAGSAAVTAEDNKSTERYAGFGMILLILLYYSE